MNGRFIDLTNGERVEVKINFGTLYYLQQCGANKLIERIERLQEQGKKVSDRDSMEIAAKFIYATLRANGQKVTFDEALSLMPLDTESIEQIVEDYQFELEKLKKKQTAKQNMKKFSQT